MKKLFLLTLAAAAAVSANAQTAASASIVGDYKGTGYQFSIEWTNTALVGNGNIRAGVGTNDLFYMLDNVNNTIQVYSKFGFSKSIALPAGWNAWVSATGDDAGHVLMRCVTKDKWPSDGAYAGAYYAEDGHVLLVLDGASGTILSEAPMMDDGLAFRFDALGHVHGDVTAGWWELIGCGDGQVCNDFMFDGIGVDCSVGCETFPLVINKAFADTGAGAGKTTGSAQVFAEDLMAVYANPVVGITGNKDKPTNKEGEVTVPNGIQVYAYSEDGDGVSSWRATDNFIVTPQKGSNNGFVVFDLNGGRYIAYVSGDAGDGVIAADAMAISKVTYADTPLIGDSDNDVLIARLYGAADAAEARVYQPASMFTCFNVEYIPSDPCSCYIYLVCQGSPMIKTKFTVPSTPGETIVPDGVEDFEIDNNAPVEFYNLQGVRVNNPENGIFIRKQGNKATKVVL